MQAGEVLAPSAVSRLLKELRELQQKPEEGIKVSLEVSNAQYVVGMWLKLKFPEAFHATAQVHITEENIADVRAEYEGPGTCAAGLQLVCI